MVQPLYPPSGSRRQEVAARPRTGVAAGDGDYVYNTLRTAQYLPAIEELMMKKR